MKRLVLGVLTSAIFAVPAFSQETVKYTLDFHFQPPSYSGCTESAVSDLNLECDTIDTSFNNFGGNPNFAWAIISNIPAGTGPGAPGGAGGAQFGIQYTAGTTVSWSLCTGGQEIPQNDALGTWPASGTGNAVTFAGGCKLVTQNEDGMTRLGFFTVGQRATPGTIEWTGDPRIGFAEAVDCAATAFRISHQALGTGDLTTGGTGGTRVCNRVGQVPVLESSWGAIKATYSN